jgi:hypothetical protein
VDTHVSTSTPSGPNRTPEEPPSRVPAPEPVDWAGKLRRAVVGAPRDLADKGLFHRLSLIPFLASPSSRRRAASRHPIAAGADPSPLAVLLVGCVPTRTACER